MFAGLKVLELASVLAGPSVGQFFAELGAEVIKVENPKTGGDVTRSWKTAGEQTDDRSAYFCSCNWGKKSIAIDLSVAADRIIALKLAAQSDIVIASYKPGDDEKLGVGYRQLTVGNPRLIYGQITGYGSENDRVGYDAVIQAESGFMDLNGEKNGPPLKMPVALIDILAAHQLKQGLLLALLKREWNDEGEFVEVSLIQTAISSLANQATNWLVAKKLPVRQGSAHPNISPYGDSFETNDGNRILLAVGNDRQFADLLQVLGIREPAMRGRFLTNEKRVENRAALNEILSEKIRARHSGELLQEIQSLKIPGGLIQNVKEALGLTQAKEILITHEDLSGIRSFVGKNSIIVPEGGRSMWPDYGSSLLPPPHLGEHTEEIIQKVRG